MGFSGRLQFFAEKVQKKMMQHGIKFRPNKPGSPHLNGREGGAFTKD